MLRHRAVGGVTLVEVLAASVIASVVAGGMMMSYVVASRLRPRQSNAAQMMEAYGLAQQTLEWIRNQVAAETPTWFAEQVPVGWQDDSLPPAAGSESILVFQSNPARRYCVRTADCDVGGDCYAVDVKVCWDGTLCPEIGSVCP